MRKIYIIGSMKNLKVVELANILESYGHQVFADWISPGPEADEEWRRYELARGRSFKQAACGPHARNVQEFDLKWLDWADTVLMVCPAGKSAHWELGYAYGQDKETFVLLDGEPERWDIMIGHATIVNSVDELIKEFGGESYFDEVEECITDPEWEPSETSWDDDERIAKLDELFWNRR